MHLYFVTGITEELLERRELLLCKSLIRWCFVSVLFQKSRPRKLVTGYGLLASRSMRSSMKVGTGAVPISTTACKVIIQGINMKQTCSFIFGQ